MDKILDRYPLTEDDCKKMGGHCYIDSNIVVDTIPQIYHRSCKHCGHTQHGQRQPLIKWTDDKSPDLV